MPTIPWTPAKSAKDATGPALAMASEFELTSLRHVPRFFLDSMRIYRQTLAADGALGVSLEARPLRGRFRTLSSWRDRAAVDAFIRVEPHRSAMRRHHSSMKRAKFVFWDAPEPQLTWDEATRHLATAGPR
ncbi:hypothetical protein [Cryptosporangium aurantiacum]|uniref:DUF3291 domain-containing protein n=1 Tax=Cryptosporangium aurantiacum TaxID=134849 RepID=A0A1M7RGN5_9ACTN|nr:hypothetical protein [Cryptosporangium aurantiacum]SHN45376.1 hypothetical protein SAMN05443668_11213 [Cryptosporangium aurantiacum]